MEKQAFTSAQVTLAVKYADRAVIQTLTEDLRVIDQEEAVLLDDLNEIRKDRVESRAGLAAARAQDRAVHAAEVGAAQKAARPPSAAAHAPRGPEPNPGALRRRGG